jgi:amino-acid N-acetyltransferase
MNATLRHASPVTSLVFRQAARSEAAAIHRLIVDNLEAGHLLPRTLDDVTDKIARFTVAVVDETVIGCAELAPLSTAVAEVRSLVVTERSRGQHIGSRLVSHLAADGAARGFSTLCAFTHDPSHFVRLGFTIVPHVWVPEKVERDCRSCVQFRRCGQYAVTLPLRDGAQIRPAQPAAVIHGGRAVGGRRPNVERLKLVPA